MTVALGVSAYSVAIFHLMTHAFFKALLFLAAGSVIMGMGHALMEEYVQQEGVTTTPGFAKYILPTALDIPHVTSVLLTEPDPKTPLGVKGIGEPAITPTAAAIINAIHDAVGVRMTRLPATPERVMAALVAKRTAPQVAALHVHETIT
jgi:xanthine dehydrogenase molybdopterin-binding subunit B